MPLLIGKTLTEAEHRQVALLVRIHRLTSLKRIGRFYGISARWAREVFERYECEDLEEPLQTIVAFLERRDGKTDRSDPQSPSDEGLCSAVQAQGR